MQIITQAIGILGMIVAFTSFQQKTTKNILLFQTLANIMFFTHFLMLGAFTGAFLNLLSGFRCFVFYNKEHKWASGKWWLVFFIAAFTVSTFYSWEGWISILPMLGCYVFTISLYLNNPTLVRRIIWIACPMWMTYNIVNGSIGGTITEIFNFTSIIIAIIKYDVLKKGEC